MMDWIEWVGQEYGNVNGGKIGRYRKEQGGKKWDFDGDQ
jgi:hypothetical protein